MHKVQFVSKESHLTKTENVKSQFLGQTVTSLKI